jgi:hypothetical protein
LVRVPPDSGRRQAWLSAAPPDEAVSLVLDAVPEGWTADLLPLRSVDASQLKIQPGEVRELTKSGRLSWRPIAYHPLAPLRHARLSENVRSPV